MEFTVRTSSHWIKVTRDNEKRFTFAIGYNGEVKAFKIVSIGKEFMPTIKDAKEHCSEMLKNL